MNSITICLRGNLNDFRDIEIRFTQLSFPDAVSFICHVHMQGVGIDTGVDSNGTYPELLRCSHDPDSDFAPVGNQYLLNYSTHFGLRFSRNACIPSCPSSEALISAIILAVKS